MRDIILGTAVFSPGYGISNTSSRADEEESMSLIQSALKLGLRRFDTAPSYGNAERVLGHLKKSGEEFLVSTKVSLESSRNPTKLQRSVFESMERLQISAIEILYLHNENALLEGNPTLLLNELEKLKSRGIFKKLGVSIYTAKVLQILRMKFPEIDVFQVPENICDRRLRDSDFAQDMISDNREYIVRSIFLQGLLLMQEHEIPAHLVETKEVIRKLDQFAQKNKMSALDLCLAYAREIAWCNSLLVGATSPAELATIVTSQKHLPERWEIEIPKISSRLIDPRNWN